MSQIVLGGASFINLSSQELSRLLDTASHLGINRIDTAPLYVSSEIKIGSYLKKSKNQNWKISTKVGLPNTSDFNPKGIITQVNQSLNDLKVERIETLFVHSLSAHHLSYENMQTLKNLKSVGKIESIGYSGDNQELRDALSSFDFDFIMATYNPLDIGNYESIQKATNQSKVFLKRVLANGIWDRSIGKSFKFQLRKMKNLDFQLQEHEYIGRLKCFTSKIQGDAPSYFNFAKLSFPMALFVIGTRNIVHLEKLKRIEDEPSSIAPELIEERIMEFMTLELGRRWKVLT